MDGTFNGSRRVFLKAGAAAGGGLVIGFYFPGSGKFAEAASSKVPAQLNSFVKIGADNTITVVCGQSEMGQGVWTSVPMMLAEELEADWGKIKVEQGETDPAFGNPRYVTLKSKGGFQGPAAAPRCAALAPLSGKQEQRRDRC
jgi:isoquinoline 1-oxidoreductase subunit beta